MILLRDANVGEWERTASAWRAVPASLSAASSAASSASTAASAASSSAARSCPLTCAGKHQEAVGSCEHGIARGEPSHPLAEVEAESPQGRATEGWESAVYAAQTRVIEDEMPSGLFISATRRWVKSRVG